MQQVGKVRSATQAAAAPLVQKASDGVRALLKLVSSSESGYFKDGDVQATQIRQQLNSPSTETKLVGLRRAIAAEAACGTGEFTEGQSLFFADVLKNLSTCDFELKRLVYLYLVQHAQQHPDLTLLSVNGYQKDLYSSSHVVRSAALKSLSSFSMLEIVQLLLHSLKRAAADTSPLVRKTAAHAAAKVYFLDTDQREEIEAVLLQLLGDGELAVLGAALISFRLVFFQSLPSGSPPSCKSTAETGGVPAFESLGGAESQEEVLALLHPFYSRIVAVLPQLQPGPQVVAIDLLTRYCRCFFRQPQPLQVPQQGPLKQGGEAGESPETGANGNSSAASLPASALALLVSRGQGGQPKASFQPAGRGAGRGPSQKHYAPLPEDFERFREALNLLLLSDSVAVVVSACSAIECLFPSSCWDCVVMPLLRCLYTCPSDYREPLLRVIISFASACPRLFHPHMRHFYLKQTDSIPVRQQKLFLLLSLALAYPASLSTLLPEIRAYIHWAGDERLTSSVFRVFTILALRHKQAQAYCMRLFVSLLDSGSSSVASEAVVGVRTLLQQKQDEQDADSLTRLVLHLAAQLTKLSSPAARASIVWVLGKYHSQVSWLAADALRQLLKRFREEADEVKLQVLLLAVRLWAFHLKNMNEGPSEGSAPKDTLAEIDQQQQQQQEHQMSADKEPRLIPPPTREQSRLHFPRLDAMLRFLFELASYDLSNDVRDIARAYAALAGALSQPEDQLQEQQRDMRRFAERFFDSSGPQGPPVAQGAAAQPGDEALLGWDRSILGWDPSIPGGETRWPWSSLAFHTGLTFSGDVPLPHFAAADSDAALRQGMSEEEALRDSFLSLGLRPPRSGTPRAQGTHGPRSICSADVIRQENAASLMGRADCAREPLSQIDLDSFYDTDTLEDLAHLNGVSSSSANSTECTGTRSSGLGAGEAAGSEGQNEGVWAAFDSPGDTGGFLDAGGAQGVHGAPAGVVAGEDDESEDGDAVPAALSPSQAPQDASLNCNAEAAGGVATKDADWGYSMASP